MFLVSTLLACTFGSAFESPDAGEIWYQQALKAYQKEMDELERLATEEFFQKVRNVADEWERAGVDAANDMWNHGFADAWMGSAQTTGAVCEGLGLAAVVCGKPQIAKGLRAAGIGLEAASSIGQFVTSITENEVFMRKYNKYIEATHKYESRQYQKIHQTMEKMKLIHEYCLEKPDFQKLVKMKPSGMEKFASIAPNGIMALMSLARVGKQINKFKKKAYKKSNGAQAKPKTWIKARKAGQVLIVGLNGAAGILVTIHAVNKCKSADEMKERVTKEANDIREEARKTQVLVKIFKHLFVQANQPQEDSSNDDALDQLIEEAGLNEDDYEEDA